MRLRQLQEEGCWEHPRVGRGVYILSVSENRDGGPVNGTLISESPLYATPIRTKKKVSR